MSESRERGFAALLLLVLAIAVLGSESWSIARTLDNPYPKPAPSSGLFRTLASEADFAPGLFGGVRMAASAALILDPDSGLSTGTDTDGTYNGGSFLYGTYVSPVYETGLPVDNIVASWSADTPEGTWLQVDARALQGDTWTKYYTMGIWASGTSVVRRHNAGGQEDADGLVDTDNLELKRTASAVQLRATLFTTDASVSPRLRRLSVVATGPGSSSGKAPSGKLSIPPYRRAWGTDLAVPERRQNDFPDGAGWCSPTSLSMLMAYWAGRTGNVVWDGTVPETAAGVLDYAYNGTGNWIFNTAYAASLGFDTYVTRFDSLAGVERWIAAGVPVAINIEFGPGGLTGAPMPSSDGHVIVIRGFDRRGNPIANDPAARTDQGEKVRTVYDRDQLQAAWLGRPSGTVYIVFPPGYHTPVAASVAVQPFLGASALSRSPLAHLSRPEGTIWQEGGG